MLQQGHQCIIFNDASPLALDISPTDNTSVLAYELQERDNQKWIPAQEGEGAWTFKNVANGKFLNIRSDPETGVKVIGADSPMPWGVHVGEHGFSPPLYSKLSP